jgi:hypothetical protein
VEEEDAEKELSPTGSWWQWNWRSGNRALTSEVSLVALRGFWGEPPVNPQAYGAGIIAVAIFESVLSSPLEFTAVTW